MLADWNNSPWIDMSPTRTHYPVTHIYTNDKKPTNIRFHLWWLSGLCLFVSHVLWYLSGLYLYMLHMSCVVFLDCIYICFTCFVLSFWIVFNRLCIYEWMIVAYRQLSNCSAILWREHVNFQWDGDQIHFVLDQQAWQDFYSIAILALTWCIFTLISNKLPVINHITHLNLGVVVCLNNMLLLSTCRPLGHIILIRSQPVFALSP
jgi:hypothetical protein